MMYTCRSYRSPLPVCRRPVLVALLLLALTLTACDVPWQDQLNWLPSLGGFFAPDASSTANRIELELMSEPGSPVQNRRLQEWIDAFQAQHPDVQVILTLVPDYAARLQQRLDEGDPPDVFLVDGFRFPELVNAGFLEPGGSRLSAPDDFYPALRDAFTARGAFYCPPRDVSTLALIYSPARFAEAGLAPPATWSELRAAAESLTDDGQGFYGLALAPDFSRWLPFLVQAGGSVLDPVSQSMAIDSPAALAALNFYASLVAVGYAEELPALQSGWAGEAFGKGRVAMVIEGNWIVPYLAEQFPGRVYGVAELPAGPAGQATVAFTSCYAVAASSPYPEAAFALVNHLTGPAGMEHWTAQGESMPSRASLRDQWLARFPTMAPFLSGIAYARVWQLPAGFGEIIQGANRGLQQIFDDAAAPEDVLAEIESQGTRLLDRP